MSIHPQDPMYFPLPEPDEDTLNSLEKAWARGDLCRYLTRWSQTEVPSIPNPFWRFPFCALDMGCGLGKYVLAQSETFPDRAYLGVDKGTFRGGTFQQRALKANRPNLFALHTNIIPLLAHMPQAGLDQITIFYPNPWWPAKHRKKRWAYHVVLPLLLQLLKPGGEILLATNERFYLAEWVHTLQSRPGLPPLESIYIGPVRVQEGRTHFEHQFLREGIPIGEACFRRAPSPTP